MGQQSEAQDVVGTGLAADSVADGHSGGQEPARSPLPGPAGGVNPPRRNRITFWWDPDCTLRHMVHDQSSPQFTDLYISHPYLGGH